MAKILVVDDDTNAADSLSILLDAMGHEVSTALDGTRALELDARIHPQIVFLDLLMARMDGFHVAARLRARRPTANRFIVALTALQGADVDDRCKRAGIHFTFRKPIETNVLIALIDDLVRRGQAAGG